MAGARIDLRRMTREQAAAIQEITVEETAVGKGDAKQEVTRTKLKLARKIEALELLGRHLDLFESSQPMGPGVAVILVDIPRPRRPGQPLTAAAIPQLPSPETRS